MRHLLQLRGQRGAEVAKVDLGLQLGAGEQARVEHQPHLFDPVGTVAVQGVDPGLGVHVRVVDQPGLRIEVLEAVPFEGHGVGHLALGQDAKLVHQLLVGVAAVEAPDDAVDVPLRPAAVDQHHRTLLDALGGGAGLLVSDRVLGHPFLNGHAASGEGNVPKLADVAEHQHVGVEIERLALIAGELRDREAGEGEVGARALADVPGFGQVEVDQRADLHGAAGMALDRMLEHRHGEQLRAVRPDVHPHHVLHPLLRAPCMEMAV